MSASRIGSRATAAGKVYRQTQISTCSSLSVRPEGTDSWLMNVTPRGKGESGDAQRSRAVYSRAGVESGNRLTDLGGTEQHRLVVEVQRRPHVGLQFLPEPPACAAGFEQEIIGAVAKHAAEPVAPAGQQLRQVMTVLDQFAGEEKAARIDVTAAAVAETPGDVRPVIRRPEKAPFDSLRLDPIE